MGLAINHLSLGQRILLGGKGAEWLYIDGTAFQCDYPCRHGTACVRRLMLNTLILGNIKLSSKHSVH